MNKIIIDADPGEMIGRSNISLKEDGRCNVAYDVKPELFYEILFGTILED